MHLRQPLFLILNILYFGNLMIFFDFMLLGGNPIRLLTDKLGQKSEGFFLIISLIMQVQHVAFANSRIGER